MEVPAVGEMTLGMQLDACLARLDSLSSTELYGLIVVVTVAVSFWLLGSGSSTGLPDNTPVVVASAKPKKLTLDGPQPRWHILKWLNYASLLSFTISVTYVAMNASLYLHDSTSLLYYLVGWSLYLCYFFGFFGISFVQVEELGSLQAQQDESDNNINKETTANRPSNSTKIRSLHPPAQAAPVCSDPESFGSLQRKNPPTHQHHASIKYLDNDDIAQLVLQHHLKDHELEKKLDPLRAVHVRRLVVQHKLASLGRGDALSNLPFEQSLDYSQVYGANCEIVVGYVPLPVGIVGPLTLNQETVYVPMATTEGCLVASTNRGAKAITQGGGAFATVLKDGITRAPCVRMANAQEAAQLKLWCEVPENLDELKCAFGSTTSFGKLQSCVPTVAGRNVYLRLACASGDAMGMNMVSKGSLAVISRLQQQFPTLQLVALSGNMCTDKKAAATNWIEGRGKSVVAEAVIPKHVVRSTLKTTVKAMVDTNLHKNLIGSAMAGTVGGFNAHASNIVTAVFLATGQDPAQNVESSNCITLLEETSEGDLWMSVTMPSIEVGTVGGGTSLPAQSACLEAIGVRGGYKTDPGRNARQLAQVVAAATMAGELSLLAALAANTLVQAHMQHNRKTNK